MNFQVTRKNGHYNFSYDRFNPAHLFLLMAWVIWIALEWTAGVTLVLPILAAVIATRVIGWDKAHFAISDFGQRLFDRK